MSLQEFTSKIKSEGLARTNQYAVDIRPPGAEGETRNLNLLCSNITTPTTTVQVQPIQLPWKQFDNPSRNSFENVNATFYVDGNMNIKRAFDSWILQIYDNRTGVVGWRKDYVSDIIIYQKNIQDNTLYSTRLINAFPVSIGGITHTFASGAPIYELPVTFSYDYWEIEELMPGSGKSAGVENWWDQALRTAGKVLNIYQGVKNTIGNVQGQAKRIIGAGTLGKKTGTLDGILKGGVLGGSTIKNLF